MKIFKKFFSFYFFSFFFNLIFFSQAIYALLPIPHHKFPCSIEGPRKSVHVFSIIHHYKEERGREKESAWYVLFSHFTVRPIWFVCTHIETKENRWCTQFTIEILLLKYLSVCASIVLMVLTLKCTFSNM